MKTRAAVPPHGREVADGEARHPPRHVGAAMQGNDAWPQPRRDLGQLRCFSLELRPACHPASLPGSRIADAQIASMCTTTGIS